MHGIFFVLMLMSIFFYKERLYADGAYYFFHVVNGGWFHVEHGRIVLGIGQILPVFATIVNLPIQWVAVISSFGHELFYYLLFLFITIKLKNHALAIAFLLAHLVGQLWLYYTPMYEICYGGALALVFYGLLTSTLIKDDKWKIVAVICLWYALTSHLENTVVLFYLILFDVANRKFIKQIHLPVLLILFLGIALELLTLSSYEQANMNSSFHDDATFLNLFNTAYLLKLGILFITYYPEILIFNATSIVFLLVKNRWETLVIFVGANVTLLLAINNKANAIEFIRYFESMYYPLVVLSVFTILFTFYKSLSNRYLVGASALLICSMIIRLVWISEYGFTLKERNLYISGMVDQLQEKSVNDKFVIEKANVTKSNDLINWALPIEAMLYSSFDGPSASISLLTSDQLEYNAKDKLLDSTNFMLRQDEVMFLKDLNEDYFSLSKNIYYKLNSNKNLAALNGISPEVKVYFESESLTMSQGDSSYFTVVIENNSELLLPSSVKEKIYLSYHIYDEDNNAVIWDGERSPLEIDVSSTYYQKVLVKSPKSKGTFTIVPDIVVEGKQWFELNSNSKLVVN